MKQDEIKAASADGALKKEKKKSYTESEIEELVLARIAEKEKVDEATSDIERLNNFSSGTMLKDKDFIDRLYLLFGMSYKHFAAMFRDEDRVLDDAQIWEKIRFSGIS